MAVIREHLAEKGLGLHNDCKMKARLSAISHKSDVPGFRTPEQQDIFINGMLAGTHRVAFGLTELTMAGRDLAGDACRALRTRRVDGWLAWRENVEYRFTSPITMILARTSGDDGMRAAQLFLCQRMRHFKIEEHLWTFNMPTDHPRISLTDVWVPDAALLGPRDGALELAQHFVHETEFARPRPVSGRQYCINERQLCQGASLSAKLASNQAIQFPLTELHTNAKWCVISFIKRRHKWTPQAGAAQRISDKVSMCNYAPTGWFAKPLTASSMGASAIRATTVRAYLSPPPSLPHHRRVRRNSNPQSNGHLFGFIGK